ncbi:MULTISPECIES: hypothetical protein [Pseudomonas]|uniref:Lipoprotein n=1 Tax=Pseudomonas putida (strain DOT-T1E) TaxID=1196325 RepID=I7C941_PSEPT|nr:MULTISPECIES: hypothetical protein [Pseudomonas]AFO48289.1 hypothetical protein T1E_2442 [Pseudomonas putida DOT-T1E]AYN11077.1 hypothetical protein CHN49_14905 [Pseudomonas putida]UZM96309.1 hypothetical protein OPZ46_13100 [Pseudomonas putida DOT-T1E]WPO27717.1 hypothetical protein REH59_15955 [Pseudomonas sp. BO3-4]
MYRKIVPLALLATLAGCSDSQDTIKARFHKAIQASLDTRYPHCFVISSFPTKTQDFDVHGTNKALHALAQVGVVSEKEISRTEIPARLWSPARTDIYYAYDLTDEGRKYYKAGAGLCFGKAQVTAIEQFSEPSEATGQKLSNVTYAYKIIELPAWAANDQVKASIAGLGQAVASHAAPLKETRTLVLTSQGWVDDQLSVQ